jgi:heme/copper-type cytochrome/quinol oxidase subunit 2
MRDFDKSFKRTNTMVNVIFTVVAVLIVAQFAFMGWMTVKAVDAVESGSGLKGLVETVWCGSDNGTGVDCVKPEVTE